MAPLDPNPRPHRPARPSLIAAVIAALVVGVALAGCSWTENDTKAATYGLPDLAQSLMAETWVLDVPASSVQGPGDGRVTLRFEADTLGGEALCNSYFAGYTTDEDAETLTVEAVGSTLRACVEGDREAFDVAYLTALEGTLDVDATDRDRLVLTRDGVHLEYSAEDD